VVDNLVTYDPANPLGPIAAEQRALDLARSQVQLPTPALRTAPPSGAQMVGLPAWYWIDGWAPVSTSATVGAATATVTATPTSASWSPGDGAAPVTCPGPGEAWHEGVDHRFPPCGHLYTDAGDVTLSVTVTWTVSWTSTTGAGGPLPPLTTTASVPLDIGEAQAVLT